jgi:threonine synthase
MDIEVSSNFERLLFEAEKRDATKVRRSLSGLAQSGAFTLGESALDFMRTTFSSGSADEDRTAATIAKVKRECGLLIDPHSAVGVSVAEQHLGAVPMIALATAHPAKFPDAVEAACGERPELPDWARPILSREESYRVLPADLETIEKAVESRTHAMMAVG